MLMVIFGAGASYDSAPSYPPPLNFKARRRRPNLDRLPLADELFDDRPRFAAAMKAFPACLSIITALRHREPYMSVEGILQKLQAENEKHPQGHREMAAVRYYLQRMIWECQDRWDCVHNGVTNYVTLLRLIRQSPESSSNVCLVTFNYDTMLDKALFAVDEKIESMDDYVQNQYQIFKIHGSINWGRLIERATSLLELHKLPDHQIADAFIRQAPEIAEWKAVTKNYVITQGLSVRKVYETAVCPAIAIPLESKEDFECPRGHLRELMKCIPEITKVLIIGWRATDAPFLERLRGLQANLRVHIVCGDSGAGDQVVRRMKMILVDGVYNVDDAGFSQFIRSESAKLFLNG
jgi:hypothetical protein